MAERYPTAPQVLAHMSIPLYIEPKTRLTFEIYHKFIVYHQNLDYVSKIGFNNLVFSQNLTFFLDFQLKNEKFFPVEGGARISDVRIREVRVEFNM